MPRWRYRRAAIDGQSFHGWRESLNQASKLSRTFAALTEALDRRRGKRQQRITVEHVHVHAGGQAIVGSVTAGVPGHQKLADQSNATRELADNRASRCGATTRCGKPCRSPT